MEHDFRITRPLMIVDFSTVPFLFSLTTRLSPASKVHPNTSYIQISHRIEKKRSYRLREKVPNYGMTGGPD
jgi:hypothetical protein